MATTSVFRPRAIYIDGHKLPSVSSISIDINAGDFPKVTLSILVDRVAIDDNENISITTKYPNSDDRRSE